MISRRLRPVFLGRRLLPALLGLCACLMSATTAEAVVWYVDDDATSGGNGLSWSAAYDSLDDALAAAQPGDQIWVAAGRYVGNFTLAIGVEHYGGFARTETELSQRDWTANETILDGNHTGSVVVGPTGATETTRIDGFTITNGSGWPGSYDELGGGLYLRNSSPTIENNTIKGNNARNGGALYLRDSYATITNNTITGNSASNYGGGLYLNSSTPTIASNTIKGNSAVSDGGGLCLDYSSPTIANNTIADNSARGHGGGLYLHSSSPTIQNNTITINSARQTGGGLYVQYSSSATIANNTIAGNSTLWGGGGGLYLSSSSPTITNNTIKGNSAGGDSGGMYLVNSSPTIENNTIVGNSATNEGGGLFVNNSSPIIANTIIAFNSSGIQRIGGTPALRYNCVYGNTAYDFDGLADPTGTNGNISADPLLADLMYGNAHIQPDSPCVDAGSNADVTSDFDMDDETRIQPPGGIVDIGTDESDGTVWPAGPYVIVRVSPVGDDTNDGSFWVLAKRTVQAGVDTASMLGGEVWVQGGTYAERVNLPPYVHLYGGFDGDEMERDERDWSANATILDGQQQGSVVTARAGYGAVGAIDGFTITNGSADNGGGLHLQCSSPTIANNTITHNSADYGGGLSISSSSPMIVNNTITGNDAALGGGLCMWDSFATIVNNTVSGNRAALGGGLYLNSSSPTIANITITSNGSSSLGALCLDDESFPAIANTIVAFNSSGIYLFSGAGSPTLRYNCVYGNTERDYGGGITDPTGTYGNISSDPLFIQDPDPGPNGQWGSSDDNLGNVRLLSNSPCVDAGDNDEVPPDTPDLDGDSDTEEPLPFDLDGGPRFLDDPTSPDVGDPGVTGPPVVDIGAYENSAWCGDGVVNAGEECDDGPDNSDSEPDACRTTCLLASCGDIVADTDEQCDDGNTSNGDGCDENCILEVCGNGVIQSGEACDDGNNVDGDGCQGDCMLPFCGDGIVDASEQCDDGPNNSDTEPDSCRTDCREPRCGDSVVDTGEECDGWPFNSNTEPDACRTTCVLPSCGDGVTDSGEVCDDGGESTTCDSDCTFAECGDGTVNATVGEECDDGNTYPGDGCDPTCHFEPEAIPTASGWGMIALALSLLVGYRLYFRRLNALR